MKKIISIIFSLIICTIIISANNETYEKETIRNDEIFIYLYNELGYDYNTLSLCLESHFVYINYSALGQSFMFVHIVK